MRKIAIVILLLVALPTAAQRINPNAFGRELSAGIGGGGTFRNDFGADIAYWVNYSLYSSRHLGTRFGVQYMPEYLGVEDFVAFPMAFSLRTGMRDPSDAMTYGALAAMDLLDAFLWESDNIVVDMMAVFLLTLVSRAEVFVGLTPGYIFGGDAIRTHIYTGVDGNTYKEYAGVKKNGNLFCSADLGVNISWRIWRFTINLTPVARWNFTGNYHVYSAYEDTVHPQDTPINWLFGMNFGLGYLF